MNEHYSLVRAFRSIIDNGDLRKAPEEKEYHDYLRGLHGYDPKPATAFSSMDGQHRTLLVPWERFAQRDLTAGAAAGGGYLVGAQSSGQEIPLIRDSSRVIGAGATVLHGIKENLKIPKVSGEGVATWIGEQTNLPASQDSLGQITLIPKTVSANCFYSRKLLLQASVTGGLESLIRRGLNQAIGKAIDTASLVGAGWGNQPIGIANTNGVRTVAATDTSLEHLLELKGLVEENGEWGSGAFLVDPAAIKTLSKERSAPTSPYTWAMDATTIHGWPMQPARNAIGKAFAGNWSDLIIVFFGPGVEITINPHDPAGFKAAKIQMRVIAHADVALAHAGSFAFQNLT